MLNPSQGINREMWGRFVFEPNARLCSEKAPEDPVGGCGDATWDFGLWLGRVFAAERGMGAELDVAGAGTGFGAENDRTVANNSAESSSAS